MQNSITDTAYNKINRAMNDLQLTDKLLVISNLLFDCYPQAHTSDIIYNKLDKPHLKVLQDYTTLKDLYGFNEDSFVFKTLDSAHNILEMSIQLRKLSSGQE